MNSLNLLSFTRWLSALKPYHRKTNKLDSSPHQVTALFEGGTPIHHIEPHYLSFSIDISVLVGGYWWEGSDKVHKGLGALRVPPINLNSKKLDRLVKALGPAYLRVGGSEADKIHYFIDDERREDSLILTYKIWDDLHAFLQRNNLKFSFTFKYGLFKQRYHGLWQGDEISALLDYTKEKGYRIDVCELGNELNAYWAFHGVTSQPKAYKLAQDYQTFIELIRIKLPDSRIAGPGSAFWPKLGETIKPFSNITEKFLSALQDKLDIVDWHYYPFQSTRSPIRTRTATLQSVLAPNSLADYSKYAKTLRKMRDKYQPSAVLWTGETGSAQCGGQAKVSDRFASSFWWADQLGRGAQCGQSVMIRQSLVGGEYGMIDRLTLKPRSDYWVSWLWGQLMGESVFAVSGDDNYLQIYCHSKKVLSKGVDVLGGVDTLNNDRAVTLLIINMSANSKSVICDGIEFGDERYALTAKKLSSKKVLINGVRPKFAKGKLSLSAFPILPKSNIVEPYSINFWCGKAQQ